MNSNQRPASGPVSRPVPDALGEPEVSKLLKTRYMGRRYVYRDVVDSTSSFLAAMPPASAVHGTVVAADRQTAGRGRMQRTWHSPPGVNLYFSVILRPHIVPAQSPQLALVSAVGVMKALKGRYPGLCLMVKWPNDIVIGDKKVAGILCEMKSEENTVDHVIIGIGINVNSRCSAYPERLGQESVSLLDASGTTMGRRELLADVLFELETCLDLWLERGLGPFSDFLREHSALRDREVRVLLQGTEICGIARGLSRDGHLELETSGGTMLLHSGEVHVTNIGCGRARNVRAVYGRGGGR